MSSNEEAQVAQRRANLEAIVALGFRAYPNQFDHHAHGERAGRRRMGRRRPRRSRPRASKRSPPDASSASATSARRRSWCCPTDASRIQVYVRQDSLSEREYQLSQAARLRRSDRRRRAPVPHQDQRAVDLGDQPRVPRQVLPAAAREVARPAGCRDALPPALPRSDRQPRRAPGVRDPQPDRDGGARLPDQPAASSKSRRR